MVEVMSNRMTGLRKPVSAWLVALVLVSVLACALATPAGAKDNILGLSMTPSTTQAGGHPDLHTVLWMENADTGNFPPEEDCDCQDPRSTIFDAPAGVIADPHAVPQCSQSDFAQFRCSVDSQVGMFNLNFGSRTPEEEFGSRPVPVYNLTPHPGQAGLIGFLTPILNSPIYIIVSSRTESDYGLNLRTVDITHLIGISISVIDLRLWGVPADPIHDPERLGPGSCDAEHVIPGLPECIPGFKSNAPLKPFLINPTSCGQPLTVSATVISYDRGIDDENVPFPTTTGCEQLSFNPSLFGQPTTKTTDSPSGLEVNLTVPQGGSPNVPAPSEIRGTTVTLPEGFSINTNAVDGKTACTDAQANIGIRDLPAECPEYSKVGTLSVSSSALPGPFSGFVYIGEPRPGNRYRLLLAADGFGLHVKLPGSVKPDPATGRVTVSFQDLPQFPFSNFNIHFFGSERGILATPTRCGTYSVDSTFTPWDGVLPDQSSRQFFTIDSGPNGTPCPGATRPFDPGFRAGVADKTAGVHAPFSLELSRSDGDQNLRGVRVTSPPGFSASLRGVSYCPESAIAQLTDTTYLGVTEQTTSACPSASQVGTVAAGAGAGSRPLFVNGKAYLAGPYHGSPLSLEFVVPAVSGPYDLGNIAVRTAIDVDPATAQVTAISDPLPQIFGGIPLRTREIQVHLDRPDFALNPTNCDPMAVDASIFGDEGGVASRRTHFQVANCADLDYAPKLSLRLTGGVRRHGHPAIHAVLDAKPDEANSRRISVTLPKDEFLDNSHISTVCTRVAFAQEACPPESLIGRAEATTPLLERPLSGGVYLRSSSHKLPDMVLDLKGQIDIELVGKVDSVKGRLRTIFASIPDAPISKFVLDLQGGRRGS